MAKSEVKHVGDKIEIYRYNEDGITEWISTTNYRDDLYSLIKDKTFGLKNGYPHCWKLEKDLHRIVMEFWYGEDVCKEFIKDGEYVIDHIDNKHLNSEIDNLHFITRRLNTSKGSDYDVEVGKVINIAAIAIYKNFNTGNYQLVIAYNVPANFYNGESVVPVFALYLQYDDDFRTAMYEANLMINSINKGEQKIPLNKYRWRKIHYRKAEQIIVQEGEERNVFFERNGEIYAAQYNPHFKILSIPPVFDIDKD